MHSAKWEVLGFLARLTAFILLWPHVKAVYHKLCKSDKLNQ